MVELEAQWQEQLDDAELTEGTDSADSFSSLLPASGHSQRCSSPGWTRALYRRRPLVVCAGALLALTLLLASGRGVARSHDRVSDTGIIGLVAADCDPNWEEVKNGRCYAKCSVLTGGEYVSRAGPATCCRGTGTACLWIGNLKTEPRFNTRANANAPCEAWEELSNSMCYTKCANLTNGTHKNRISPITCCSGEGMTCMNPAYWRTDMSFSEGGSRDVFNGDCAEGEEKHLGLCYTKCETLTNGLYNNRVAAETCCNGTGATCMNPLKLKTDLSYSAGGGRKNAGKSCESHEESYAGLCYIRCDKLTDNQFPNRVAAATCCNGTGTSCLSPSRLLTKPWFAAGGGRWAARQPHGNATTCAELEELYLGLCYKTCAELTNNTFPNRVAAATCCKKHGWDCLNPSNLKTSAAFAAGGGRKTGADCKSYEESFGGICYLQCSKLTKNEFPYRLTAVSCCKKSGIECLLNPSLIRTRSWFAGGGGRFGTKSPEESNKCKDPESEEHAGMCFKKCSLLTDGEFPYRVTVATCCRERSFKCIEAQYRKTDPAFSHRMDGDSNNTQEEDPDLAGTTQVAGCLLFEQKYCAADENTNLPQGPDGEISRKTFTESLEGCRNFCSSTPGCRYFSYTDAADGDCLVYANCPAGRTYGNGEMGTVTYSMEPCELDATGGTDAPAMGELAAGEIGAMEMGALGETGVALGQRVNAGGKSKRAPTAEDLEVWRKVVANVSSFDNVDLASLGDPISVVAQVVAGMNYDFRFANGTVVSVFEGAWTNTLEVTGMARREVASGVNGTEDALASGAAMASSDTDDSGPLATPTAGKADGAAEAQYGKTDPAFSDRMDGDSNRTQDKDTDLAGTTQAIAASAGHFHVKTDGWSTPQKPNSEDVLVWENAADEVEFFEMVNLTELGVPQLVQAEAKDTGTNYRYIFANGMVVSGFRPLKSDTLDIIGIERPKSQEELTTTVNAAESAAAAAAAAAAMKPDWTDADDSVTTTLAPQPAGTNADEPVNTMLASESAAAASAMRSDWTDADKQVTTTLAPQPAGTTADGPVNTMLASESAAAASAMRPDWTDADKQVATTLAPQPAGTTADEPTTTMNASEFAAVEAAMKPIKTDPNPSETPAPTPLSRTEAAPGRR